MVRQCCGGGPACNVPVVVFVSSLVTKAYPFHYDLGNMQRLQVVLFRVIGGCILFQCIMFSRHIRLLWVNIHQGVPGVVYTAISIIMFALALVGAIALLIPKQQAPYFIYASLLCFCLGGLGFSFIPFLLRFLPREFWGIGIMTGNVAVALCLGVLQVIHWRAARLRQTGSEQAKTT